MNATGPVGQPEGLDSKSIEQIVQHFPFDCRLNTRKGYHFVTATADATRHLHAHCHQLRCRTCARHLHHTFCQALDQACHTHHLTCFVTLTLPASVSSPHALQQSLRRFLQEARRTHPDLQYCWMVGVGRHGALHLHMLLNRDIRRTTHYGHRTEWLKRTWLHLTGAHQAKLVTITSGTEPRVVRYMLRNMFRTVTSGVTFRRRYGSSRAIKLNPKPVRDPNALRYVRHKGSTGNLVRRLGLDPHPFMNPDFDLPSTATSRVEPPLCDGGAADGAPAGGRDVLVAPPMESA